MKDVSLSKIFLIIVGSIVLFKIIEGAFWMMSQRSTALNISGFALALFITISLLIIFIKIKKQKQHEK